MKKFIFGVFIILSFIGCQNTNKQSEKPIVNTNLQEEHKNPYGIWKKEYYVDEFGERTKQGYIYTDVLGTFSNSVTTDSRLGVLIIVEKSRFAIVLDEYARNHITKDTGFLHFKVKNKDGKVMNFETLNDQGYNRVYGDKIVQDNPNTVNELIEFLNAGGEMIFIAENSNSKYRFKLNDTSFLQKALDNL